MESKAKAVIIVAVLVLVAVAAVCLSHDEDEDRVFPLPITEEDKEYPPSDEARIAMESWIEDLETELDDPQNSHIGMAKAINDATVSLLTIQENHKFVTLDYHLYPAEMGEEYVAWNTLLAEAYDGYMTVIKKALNGPTSETVMEALESRDEDPSFYLEYEENSLEERTLIERQNELIVEYDNIIGATSTNAAEELDKYTKAIETYIDLVRVNNEYATLQGYDNYIDYVYETSFGRDYTAYDVDGFMECMDEALNVYALASVALRSDDLNVSNLDWMKYLDHDDVRPYIEPFMDSIDRDMGDLLDYLYEYELMYTDIVEGQIQGGFRANLDLHRSSLIYMPSGNHRFMVTLTHELGHASHNNLMRTPSYCFDIREIHSTGLEILLCEYQELNSMRSSETMTMLELSQIAFNIILSGALTELENWAYTVDADKEDGIELTVEGLVEKFGNGVGSNLRLTKYIDAGYGFIWISHIVSTPGYYISYGVSSLNAADIWLTSKVDFDAAAKMYVGLLKQSGIDGYTEAVELAGLPNMLERENAEDVLNEVFRIMNEAYPIS